MKKQTKQKINNKWNKMKKPLMVISIIFNIIFFIFIIVGCVTPKKDVNVINSNDTQERYHYSNDNPVISDLSGTYWIVNSNPVKPNFTISVYINFKSNNVNFGQITLVSQNVLWSNNDGISYAGTAVYGATDGWLDEAYRTIEIIDGEDVTDEALIDWLTSNATQVNVIDLTNTSWILGNVVDINWRNDFDYYINFNSNGNNYTNFRSDENEAETGIEALWFNNTEVYQGDSIGSWNNQAYRFISITNGNDVFDPDLLVWLTSNATFNGYIQPVINDYEPVTQIYLGDNFVPSVYITQNADFILNGFAGYHSQNSTSSFHLGGFTFISNDTTFNRITLIYGTLNAVNTYVTTDGQTLTDVSSMGDYMCCIGIRYAYYNEQNELEKSVLVASNRKTTVTDNSLTLNVVDVRPPFIVWVNDAYRTLNIVDDTKSIVTYEYLTIQNMSAVQLLQVTSNVSTSAVGISNVNNLLSGAFSSLSSLFGMMILPGITLGLLLFLPLVVTILVAVIRLIRK